MGTIADKFDKLIETKADIKDAITEKGQSVSDVFSTYGDAIRAIETGTDTSDATASASDILSGKTAYGSSGKITGTIPSKSSSDLSASAATVTVPSGYYPSQASKSVATATQATPTISVSSTGLITASSTQSAGYVSSGTKTATNQLSTQSATTITPGSSSKTAVTAGKYTTGAVTVAGDANLVAGNIKNGVSIFGVTGSFAGGGDTVNVSLTKTTSGPMEFNIYYSDGESTYKYEYMSSSSNINVLKNSLMFISISSDRYSKTPVVTGGISIVSYMDPYNTIKLFFVSGAGTISL